VSSYGKVKSLLKNNIWSKWDDWYMKVTLCSKYIMKYVRIHQLVAKAFIINPDNKKQINHINWIKYDNRVENLEWVTASENQIHAYRNGLSKITKNNYFLTNHPSKGKFWSENKTSKKILQFTKDNIFIRCWDSWIDVQRELWINSWNISSCCSWRKYFKTVGWFIWKYK